MENCYRILALEVENSVVSADIPEEIQFVREEIVVVINFNEYVENIGRYYGLLRFKYRNVNINYQENLL